MSYQPIIIIGAPRSGTNMLRDVLCELEGVGTWPCDEINYIWRHGNIEKDTDEFSAEMLTPKIKKYIQNEFDSIAKKYDLEYVVEKTCANSLRVPFVDAAVPNAKYIFIYRDGVDAAGSAKKRWTAKLDIPYILKKVKYVPFTDLPYYGFKYFFNRVYRVFSKEERLAFWGPKFNGLDEALEQYSLEEVSALQWKKCVDASENAFQNMPNTQVIRVKYENFVTNPQEELQRILSSLNVSYDNSNIENIVSSVTSKSIGKGRQAFDEMQTKKITKLVEDTLRRYGYQ